MELAINFSNMLWHGIGHYIAAHDIDVMFGCASFSGTDPKAFAQPLSFLYHTLQTPPDYYVRALEDQFVDMSILAKDEIDERAALRLMPPLNITPAELEFGLAAIREEIS